MKRPTQRGVVPPGGMCRYVDPDAGFKVAHPYYDFCKAKALAERQKRNLETPYDWDAFFDEQLCKATPQACVDVPDVPPETGPSWGTLAVQFGTAVVRWIIAGAPVTTWDEFRTRHAQCSGDPEAGIPRCQYFTRFRSTGITKCGRCGCSSLKLFLKSEHCPLKKW